MAAQAQVRLIAWTHFEPPAAVPWETDAEGGQALAEFAGRACYESWDKPNPATATNRTYLAHILEVGHLSVLEHGSATFYLTGVSRSFTHELVRHRHLSYSQLSQRYVPEHDAAMVEPDVIAADPELHERFVAATEASRKAYEELLAGLEARLAGPEGRCGASRPGRRRGRCCRTPPRRGSWSPATTGPGGISCRPGPASTPTWRSARWRWRSCAS
jgi:thymidylate synthase (FAD)